MRTLLTAILITCGCLAGTVRAQTFPSYLVQELAPLPGGTSCTPLGINDFGIAVGWSYDSNGYLRAVVWTNGVPTDLGDLGEPTPNAAYAINNDGMIAGSATIPGGKRRAFLLSGGTMTNLGIKGGTWSAGLGMNEHGDVCGVLEAGDFSQHAFYWTPQQGIVDLMTISGAGNSWAWDINSQTQVVGYSALPGSPGSPEHPMYWQDLNGNHTNDNNGEMFTFAPFTGRLGRAYTITERGEVSGWNNTQPFGDGGFEYIFLNDLISTQNLLAVPGDQKASAWDMNEGGLMVGYSSNTNIPEQRAFAWYDGVYAVLSNYVINISGWNLTNATAVNNFGRIAGSGYHLGNPRGFLLTPISPTNSLGTLSIDTGLAGSNDISLPIEMPGLGPRFIVEGLVHLTNGAPWNYVDELPWPSTQRFWNGSSADLSQRIFRVRGVVP